MVFFTYARHGNKNSWNIPESPFWNIFQNFWNDEKIDWFFSYFRGSWNISGYWEKVTKINWGIITEYFTLILRYNHSICVMFQHSTWNISWYFPEYNNQSPNIFQHGNHYILNEIMFYSTPNTWNIPCPCPKYYHQSQFISLFNAIYNAVTSLYPHLSSDDTSLWTIFNLIQSIFMHSIFLPPLFINTHTF